MPEIPEVIPGEFIFDTWGNPVARRTIQRYQDSAQLATLNPTPEHGDVAYLLDVNHVQWFNGSAWVPVFLNTDGTGVMSGTLNAGGHLMTNSSGIRLLSHVTNDIGTATAMLRTLYTQHIAAQVGTSLITFAGSAVTVDTAAWFFPNIPSSGDAASAVLDAADGRIKRSTSARKYKTNIEPAPQLADLQLVPVTFHRDDDDKDFIGFIADDLADQDSRIGEYSPDGEIENYDLRAVVAILAAKVNDLTARIEALEA